MARRITSTDDHASFVAGAQQTMARRRDQIDKRKFYLDARVPEYWMIDPDLRELVRVTLGTPDAKYTAEMRWWPGGASKALEIDVAGIFG